MTWFVVALLVAMRVHNALTLPTNMGWDAYAHQSYVVSCFHGKIPLPNECWASFHPPLYYLVSAGLAKMAGNVDLAIRASQLVSMMASLISLVCTGFVARRLIPGWESVAVLGVALIPAEVMTAAMCYNQAFAGALCCVFFCLYLKALDGTPVLKRECLLGLLMGAALSTRPEGLVLAALLGILWLYRLRLRQSLRDSTLSFLLASAIGVAVSSWFFLRNLAHFGLPWIHNAAWDAFPLFYSEFQMLLPDFISLSFYLNLPLNMLLDPKFPSVYDSYLLTSYASIWWDYFGFFLMKPDVRLARILLVGGLLPTLLMLHGFFLSLTVERKRCWPLAMLFLLSLSIQFGMTLQLPIWCAVKGNYLYPAYLSMGLFMALSTRYCFHRQPRAALAVRIAVLLYALAVLAAFWL